MAFEYIGSTDDSRLALYHEMSDAELMRSRGLFVAEGRLVVRRVIEDGRYRVQSVLVSEAARRSLEQTLESVARDVPIYVCHANDFLGITGHNIHRGCLALVERPPARAVEALLRNVAQAFRPASGNAGLKPCATLVILEDVANADNVGGVFRNAAAFGAGGVLLSPACCDPLYRKAIRTSMAAVLHVPFARAGDWPEALSHVRTAGFTIVALTPREPSETLDAFRSRARPDRVALVVGAEGAGLTPRVESSADHRVRIPISDGVDSLNVAVAVGIALYRFRNW